MSQQQVCGYTARLTDAYGNGWEGASLSFTNVLTGSFDISGLSVPDDETSYETSLCFDCGCYYGQATPGDYPSENSWSVIDSTSRIVASGKGTDSSDAFCTVSSDCPPCVTGSGRSRSAGDGAPGSDDCQICAPGSYDVQRTGLVCALCGAGRYNSETGSTSETDCIGCEAGKHGGEKGATSDADCNSCADGYSSIPGSAYCYPENDTTLAFAALFYSTGGEEAWFSACRHRWFEGDPCKWFGVTCDDDDNVVELRLTDCGLTGPLPREIGKLQFLEELNLSVNKINGNIPPELGNLKNLVYLFLYANEITGQLPLELGQLHSLNYAFLYENLLTGLPPELGQIRSLEYLDLRNNQLEGSIPPELARLEVLDALHLDNNKLSGGIPKELGQLKSLTVLSLRSNELSGTIPAELGNLRHLWALELSENDLWGTIPKELGSLESLDALWLSYNHLSGPVPSDLQKWCNKDLSDRCVLYHNDLTCPQGTSLLVSGCTPCPFPERCPGGTTWGEYCTAGFELMDCSRCPRGSYIIGDSCLPCGSGWANGFESIVYLLIVITSVSALLGGLIKWKVFSPGAIFQRINLDINMIVCIKQLGALLQIMTLLCSVVVTPAWFGKLSNTLDKVALPIQINAPCVPALQSQPKYIQGITTIILISVVTSLMAIAPFLPFIKSRLSASTLSKIQKMAGVIVGQSTLVCISATLQQLAKTPVKVTSYRDLDFDREGFVTDDRDKYSREEVFIELTIAAILIWGVSTLYSRAVAKFEESRNASDRDQTGSASASEGSASMLPFYSSFCMPYVSTVSDHCHCRVTCCSYPHKLIDRFLTPNRSFSYQTPAMSDFDLTALARKIAAFLLSVIFGSLKYYFIIQSPAHTHAIIVACAGLQSTLFIWLNVWYISHLVKMPYISGRKCETIGDPLNDADMLTTRVYIWSSALLALSSVLEGQLSGGSEFKATIMNVLCGVILVALIWPQRLLFLGMRHSLNELWARERNDDAAGVATTKADGTGAEQSAKRDAASKLVEKMMRARNCYELFALERDMLKRNDLSAIERARWTSKAVSNQAESDATLRDFCGCLRRPACLRKLKTHRAGRIALRIMRLLVGSTLLLLIVGSAYEALQIVVKSPGARSESVWVSVAVLSAVLSEALRVRWTRSYVKTALKKHSSNIGDTIDNAAAADDDDGDDDDDDWISQQVTIELVEVRAGSEVSIHGRGNVDDSEGVTMEIVANPMIAHGGHGVGAKKIDS